MVRCEWKDFLAASLPFGLRLLLGDTTLPAKMLGMIEKIFNVSNLKSCSRVQEKSNHHDCAKLTSLEFGHSLVLSQLGNNQHVPHDVPSPVEFSSYR